MAEWHSQDEAFMRVAMTLAAAQLGRTALNPAVGCVVLSAYGEVCAVAASYSTVRLAQARMLL